MYDDPLAFHGLSGNQLHVVVELLLQVLSCMPVGPPCQGCEFVAAAALRRWLLQDLENYFLHGCVIRLSSTMTAERLSAPQPRRLFTSSKRTHRLRNNANPFNAQASSHCVKVWQFSREQKKEAVGHSHELPMVRQLVRPFFSVSKMIGTSHNHKHPLPWTQWLGACALNGLPSKHGFVSTR